MNVAVLIGIKAIYVIAHTVLRVIREILVLNEVSLKSFLTCSTLSRRKLNSSSVQLELYRQHGEASIFTGKSTNVYFLAN